MKMEIQTRPGTAVTNAVDQLKAVFKSGKPFDMQCCACVIVPVGMTPRQAFEELEDTVYIITLSNGIMICLDQIEYDDSDDLDLDVPVTPVSCPPSWFPT
jgi:hypothetical protein